MLPELTDRVKGWMARREQSARPITLDLKSGLSGFYSETANANWLQHNGFYGLASAWGGGGSPSWSGESVTLASALNHSVVFTCKRIIAESTGMLPCPMMRRKGEDKVEAVEHPMFNALQNAPNEEVTAQGLRETTTGHAVLGGNGYVQIFRRSGTGVANELFQLLPGQVTPDRERYTPQKRLVYVVQDGRGAPKTFTVERGKPQDILHIPGIGWDGLVGYSVLSIARQSFGTAIAAERNVGRFYARGGRVPYNLKLSQDWENDQAAEKFRHDWNELYSNPSESPILPPWLEYQQTGLSLVDSQMLEQRQFSVPEICRWFRISPHLAGDLSRATFSNIEQLALEFVNFTLHVWLRRWEQNLWRCVLTPEEKQQGYFWRHNVNALLRGDFKARMEGYSIALQNGFMSQNEVRDLEDWNGFEGGDDYHIQLNMQQLPTAPGTPGTGQERQGSLVKLGNGKKYRRVA